MAEFRILDYLDKLESDGGTNYPNGDHSFNCPACGAPNFKVNLNSNSNSYGLWGTFSCDCANTEGGKRKVREALSPAVSQSRVSTKAVRPAQRRSWNYFTPVTLERQQPALIVHRTDDGSGKRKIWQESLINGHGPAVVKEKVLPYGLPEALQAIEDGTPHIFWVEGEPCVDALRAMGLSAVSSIGGAGKFKPERDAGHIPPDRLVVVPDRDKPGMAHMQDVAAAHPGCQWLFPFPGTKEWNGSMPATGGLDVADWIDLGARRNRSSRELDRRLWRAFSWTTWIVPMRKPWNHWPHVLMHSLIQSCSMGCLMQSSVDQRTWRCLGGRNSSIASAFPTTASTPTCSSATAKQRSKRSVSPSTPLASPPSKN